MKNNELEQFVSQFCNWCDMLNTSSQGDTYSVPYFVFEVDKDIQSYLTMEAVVLSDILIDSGLRGLCRDNDDPLYLSDSYLYNLISKYNSPILDKYNDYEYDPNILQLCGIHGGSR